MVTPAALNAGTWANAADAETSKMASAFMGSV